MTSNCWPITLAIIRAAPSSALALAVHGNLPHVTVFSLTSIEKLLTQNIIDLNYFNVSFHAFQQLTFILIYQFIFGYQRFIQ